MLTGAALMLFPYFVEGITVTIATGVLLLALPFVADKISH